MGAAVELEAREALCQKILSLPKSIGDYEI